MQTLNELHAGRVYEQEIERISCYAKKQTYMGRAFHLMTHLDNALARVGAGATSCEFYAVLNKSLGECRECGERAI